MAKYRKKPVVIEAVQWNKNGDHPLDGIAIEKPFSVEGELVRYYRTPKMDGQDECKYCGQKMHFHGWIDTMEGGHIVCPGDWIITGVAGENYPCKNEVFIKTYEAVE